MSRANLQLAGRSERLSRILSVLVLLLVGVADLPGLSAGDTYWSSEDWHGTNATGEVVISGEVTTKVEILLVGPEFIRIRIHKEITPFSEILDFEASTFLKATTYDFGTQDNWGNDVFGHFSESNGKMQFLLDCRKFSEEGENLGRMYGETYQLEQRKS